MAVMKKVVALLLIACVPGFASAQTARAHYEGYSAGFNILRMDAEFTITPRDYKVHLAFRTAGTLSAVIRSEQSTVVDGVFAGGDPAPRQFFSHGHLRGRSRVTQIDYPGGRPDIRSLVPPNDEER